MVIEVLDARDPQSTRCTDMERYVRRAGPEKKLVLLLNKIGKPSAGGPACASHIANPQVLTWKLHASRSRT